jgi:hypothetical protein
MRRHLSYPNMLLNFAELISGVTPQTFVKEAAREL